MKICLLCHTNNKLIESKLGLDPAVEFAPWITKLLEMFENTEGIEIHAVLPHKSITQPRHFVFNGISYHLYPYKPWFIPDNWPIRISNAVNILTFYRLMIHHPARIIQSINPDLVHVFGYENLQYSRVIPKIVDKYPVLMTIQCSFDVFSDRLNNYMVRMRVRLMEGIIRKIKYFGIAEEHVKTIPHKYSPHSVLFYHDYPKIIPQQSLISTSKKTYDCIFYARVTKLKGIEDFINAIGIVKRSIDNIKCCIVGYGHPDYVTSLMQLIKGLNLDYNIDFIGGLSELKSVHEYVAKSRICVLPTWTDLFPASLVESMMLKVPCISYPVGGIPAANIDRICIKLVKMGNVKELSEAIIELITNPISAQELADNAYEYAFARWSEGAIKKQFLSMYREVLGHNSRCAN